MHRWKYFKLSSVLDLLIFSVYRKKHVWGSDFASALRGLYCYSNFNFFYIDNKEETNLITRGID